MMPEWYPLIIMSGSEDHYLALFRDTTGNLKQYLLCYALLRRGQVRTYYLPLMSEGISLMKNLAKEISAFPAVTYYRSSIEDSGAMIQLITPDFNY